MPRGRTKGAITRVPRTIAGPAVTQKVRNADGTINHEAGVTLDLSWNDNDGNRFSQRLNIAVNAKGTSAFAKAEPAVLTNAVPVEAGSGE